MLGSTNGLEHCSIDRASHDHRDHVENQRGDKTAATSVANGHNSASNRMPAPCVMLALPKIPVSLKNIAL